MKILTAQGETQVLSNAPVDPFVLFSESISDLILEAENFLDGKEIENEEQEAAIASIVTRLRREAKGADEQRAKEKKPHDDAAKVVQAKWLPILNRADIAIEMAKKVLTKYLLRKQEDQRAAVEAAKQEAEKLAVAARTASQQASETDLAGQTVARVLSENAAAAAKAAEKLEKAPVQAKGGERAIGLRTVWVPTITDHRAVLTHYAKERPDDLKAWLQSQVEADCRVSKRNIPGVTYTETGKAS